MQTPEQPTWLHPTDLIYSPPSHAHDRPAGVLIFLDGERLHVACATPEDALSLRQALSAYFEVATVEPTRSGAIAAILAVRPELTGPYRVREGGREARA